MARSSPYMASVTVSVRMTSGISKKFAFTERISLDFRAEAFNMFNRVRFSSGATSLDSQTFGQVTSQANSPRRMQFGLKLYW